MRKAPEFLYEDNKTLCILTDSNGHVTVGTASCHPDDADMANNRTGQEIAYRRAEIEAYRKYRNEIKIKLSALNQLYYSMNRSKNFNPKSYENRMLQRQIRFLKEDLAAVNELLATLQENLREYIQKKDDFYKAIRKNRQRRDNKANS